MPGFRTEIKIARSAFSLNHQDHFFCIGSCFADHIHSRLREDFFYSGCNPCGIVYNPFSISHQMMQVLDGKMWDENDLVYHDDLYHGMHHHGSYSHPDKVIALDGMNKSLIAAQHNLYQVSCMVITLGTAIVYTLKERDILVANCHKIPASHFDRRMLSVQEIVDSNTSWIARITDQNPGIKIILTISPVRYLKEGFTDNTLSKARLALAVEQLCKTFHQVHYFPAYEILLDDLRDYRFYKEDMIHPGDQAIDYIWEAFLHAYMDNETMGLIKTLKKIKSGLAHRPLHENTPAHTLFVKRLNDQINEMKSKYPFINFG